MTRIAALYDIHGNLPALEAVLADVDADVVVVGGDVVWGPWPRETLETLLDLRCEVTFIMGNADRDVFDRVEGNWKASNEWCADRLSEPQLEFLRARPATIAIDGTLFCHGSPRSDLDPMTVGTSEEEIREWCRNVTERIVVCGHTHAQFDRTLGDLRVVNAGSVGQPFEGLGAYWATFASEVELRFTPYDTSAVADQMRTTDFPDAQMAATNICSRMTAEDAAQWFA